jgi:hypothetical protein
LGVVVASVPADMVTARAGNVTEINLVLNVFCMTYVFINGRNVVSTFVSPGTTFNFNAGSTGMKRCNAMERK